MPNAAANGAPIRSALISAIVPARNEEASIASCIESLACQTEISQILVVNDESTDKTAEIIRGLLTSIPSLRLLETQGVPEGWIGKNHAVALTRKRRHKHSSTIPPYGQGILRAATMIPVLALKYE